MKKNKYDWSNKEQFLRDLKKSSCMSDFLNQQGLTATSGNFFTFKKWVKKHDLEINHFFRKVSTDNIQLKYRKRLSSPQIFSSNSYHINRETKKRMIEESIIPYICSGCENPGMWNGKPLTLQLEHKNGNNTDNRIENLEYLCPNCHSQTKTYGSKNLHLKLFNQRITELIEIKNINEEAVLLLTQRWGVSYGAVKEWIHRYADKIKEHDVTIEINKNFTSYRQDRYDEILKDVSNSDLSLLSLTEISKKHNKSIQLVRKLVKNFDSSLYLKLEESITGTKQKEAEIIQKERLNYVKNMDRNNFDMEDMKKFFNMNLEGLMPWILKNDLSLYQHIKSLNNNDKCPHCDSENTIKKGTTGRIVKLKRKQCKDCQKYFTYI